MRYFKYKNTGKTEKNALKIQYSRLTKQEKRLARKKKALDIIALIVLYGVSILCFACCVAVLENIPEPGNAFIATLFHVGRVIMYLVAGIVSLIIGGIAASPIYSKAGNVSSTMKRDVMSKACDHLREYYGLQEPYIVTKCYESSDKRFSSHDVCIFVAGDELRITTNLIHGFLHGENDTGCYALNADEISLAKIQGEKFLMAELKASDTVFLLGYRAKSFIEKNFISKGGAA